MEEVKSKYDELGFGAGEDAKDQIDFIISDKNRWIIYRDCSIMNTEIYFK